MVVTAAAWKLELERHALEDVIPSLEVFAGLEDEPVASGGELLPESRDPPVGVGPALRDRRGAALQEHADACSRPAQGEVENVRGEGRGEECSVPYP